MTIPPSVLSGTANNSLPLSLQFIYDASISGYRAITANDLNGSVSGSNITGSVNINPVPSTAATSTFVQFNANLISGANVAHRVTGSTAYCQGVEFYNPNNTGSIQLGTAQRQLRALGYGEPISYAAPQGKQLDLSQFCFSGSVSGQSLVVTYFN